jgi:hypothetical protein
MGIKIVHNLLQNFSIARQSFQPRSNKVAMNGILTINAPKQEKHKELRQFIVQVNYCHNM